LLVATVAGLCARVPALALPDLRDALGLGQDEVSCPSTAYTSGEPAAMPFATWFAITVSLRRLHDWLLVSMLALAAAMPFVHTLAWLLSSRRKSLSHGDRSTALLTASHRCSAQR